MNDEEISEIERILIRAKSGQKLPTEELKILMLYALELLQYISIQTEMSISKAEILLSNGKTPEWMEKMGNNLNI